MIASRAVRRWLAALGSCAVYLIPLIGPHAWWFLGEELYRELTRTAHPAMWTAANIALALGAQIAAGFLLWWVLGGSPTRLLAVVVGAPLLLVTLEYAYLLAIPSWFLIEADRAPEQRAWTQRCAAPGLSLLGIRTPVRRSGGGVREWWVQGRDGRPALLRVPGCEVADGGLPQPTLQRDGRVDFSIGLQFAIPGGAAVVERLDVPTAARSWWLLRGPGHPLDTLSAPEAYEGAPILSNGGEATAWLEKVAGSGPPVLERVRIRHVASDAPAGDVVIELAPFGPASYTLLGVDIERREITLWRNDAPLIVGFEGDRRPASLSAGALRPQASTYQRYDDGWLAWDAYRDEGAYELAWSLPAGSGRHRLAKGRSIESAAIDPTGALIAVSASTTLSIGSAPDVVFVVNARDGTDVFRAYPSRYSRSPVVFFDGGLFAYSDDEGVHVLQIP